MRVLVLAQGADRSGGANVYTMDLVRRLAGRGHRLELVAYSPSREVADVCRVHQLRPRDFAQARFVWRAAGWLHLLDSARLAQALSIRRPDVVVGSSQPLNWAYLAGKRDVPLVYVPHSLVAPVEVRSYGYGCPVQERLAVRLYDRLERWSLRRAAATVRFTRAGCDALERHYGTHRARRLELMYAPTDLPPAAPPRTPGKPLRLVCVGRLVASKNVGFLVRTLAALRNADWVLDVVGDGVLRDEVERQVRDAGLSGRVRVHGHRDDVRPFYRDADLFVFPSVLENTALVLLEAMAWGVPVLAFRPDGVGYRSSNDELVRDGVDGVLAAGDADFAAKLAALLDAPGRLAAMGRAARGVVEARHDWERHLDDYERLFERVAGAKRAAAA